MWSSSDVAKFLFAFYKGLGDLEIYTYYLDIAVNVEEGGRRTIEWGITWLHGNFN